MPLDTPPQRISPAALARLERAHLIAARVVAQDALHYKRMPDGRVVPR